MSNKILKPKEVAASLGIGLNRAYELMHRRDFPSFRLGRTYHISEKALDNWIEKQGMEGVM